MINFTNSAIIPLLKSIFKMNWIKCWYIQITIKTKLIRMCFQLFCYNPLVTEKRRLYWNYFKFQTMHSKCFKQKSKPESTFGLRHILTDPEQKPKFCCAQMAESNIPVLPRVCADWEKAKWLIKIVLLASPFMKTSRRFKLNEKLSMTSQRVTRDAGCWCSVRIYFNVEYDFKVD